VSVLRALCCALLLLASGPLVAAPGLAEPESAVFQPGPQATGDNTYVAYIEQPASGRLTGGAPFQISGWMGDSTAQGWAGFDQIQIYNGLMDDGGTLLSTASIGLDRPDVARATADPGWQMSGFVARLNPTTLPVGTYVLLLYAHTPAKGWWYTSFPLSVSGSTTTLAAGSPIVAIDRPRADETVPGGTTTYTISGSAVDPAATRATGDGVDRVEVYLGGPRGEPRSTPLGDATINATAWSLNFAPNLYSWGSVSLYVYAHSRLTGQESYAVHFFSIQ
jgi:hypothetical protein